MIRTLTSVAAMFVLLIVACPAWADMTLYVAGVPQVTGSGSAAPGFGTSSWKAAAGAGQKSELYLTPGQLFGHDVTIGNIESISYWTNNPVDNSTSDWGLLLYTVRQQSGNSASWYHTRLNSEPYLTGAGNVANTWTEWSTDDPNHPLRFYDANRNGGVYGMYTDPTLANLNPAYLGETIQFFSLQTGSGWASGFTGLVDGLDVRLKTGEEARVNLETAPVPEPSAILLMATMLGMVGFGLRRRLSHPD